MMGYYDREEGVREYLKMAEGYDGAQLIEVLKGHLPAGSTVLELGMGPGKDLDLLSQAYKAIGSDTSQLFLDLYRRRCPEADLLLLDAKTIDTARTFDGIYSNKVLIHLDADELKESFTRQAQVLNRRGWAMHSFWYGDEEDEEHHGLKFYYYSEEGLTRLAGGLFEIVAMARYREMEDGDSIYVLMRKRQ
jgi:cyclopropane fatty-acyl-phospholipid synthase-like methyltransferase